MCVCLSGLFNEVIFDRVLDVLDHVDRSSSKVKVIVQRSESQDVVDVVGATSSEGFLVFFVCHISYFGMNFRKGGFRTRSNRFSYANDLDPGT